MNILMISLDRKIFEPGSEVGQRMIRYGKLCDKLTIIVLTKRGLKEARLAENVWAHPTNSWHRFSAMFDAYGLAKKLLIGNQSIGNQWLVTTQDPFETAFAGLLIKHKFKIPLQIQIHTDFLSPYFARESFWQWKRVNFAKWTISKADCLRVVSERIKKSIEVQFKNLKIKISVVPIYVDISKIIISQPNFDLHQKYSSFDFIILSLARLSQEKNLSLLIDSFKEVVKKYPKVLLLIVGEGLEKQNLEAKIENYGLENNVIIGGWTDDKISYHKTADLFVLSSNYEGYGMAAVEAMAAGCPVAMTDVGCAGEIIRNGENGLVVPVNDKKALSKAIMEMIERPEMRQKFIERGLEIVKTMPSEEEILSKIFQCP